MTDMASPVIYFIAFAIFIFCQYAIFVVSNLIANYFGCTGSTYWCVVCVCFLVLNQFCFGAYDFSLGLVGDDDLVDGWEQDLED